MAAFSEGPSQECPMGGQDVRDALGSDWAHSELGCVVQDHRIFEGKLRGVPGRQSKERLGRGIHGFAGGMGLTLVIMPCVLHNGRTVEYIGGCQALEQQLYRKVFYPACRHPILEVWFGAVWGIVWERAKAPENLGSSTSRGPFGQIFPQGKP
ncbi:hypothetical protein GWK47_050039 [Chionoecetes opilio]|uniref:Uncharacterized protein n=1 Tax=Chionoecetes opilio TaxID=41210 RepID=A0A8J5CRE7_CHIOP|nr:hypothetical protein GWK47_050039 [Chionoecetes opilio]